MRKAAASGAIRHDAWPSLVELVPDGVLETSGGAILRANTLAATLLGCDCASDALVGRALAEVLEPLGEGPLERDSGEVVPCRVLGLDSKRHVNLRTSQLGCGRALHVLVVADEQERANVALIDTKRDLAEARREAEALRSAFDSSVAERQELVAVVCHELRTPITVIRGYARLLLSDDAGSLSEQQQRFIEEQARSCGRIDDFVELLLCASRDERSADEVNPVEASLAPLLKGVAEYLRPVIVERGTSVELALDPDALWACFDASRIEQVITNLVANGLEYAGSNGKLRIHTRQVTLDEEPWVEVGVSDEGPGVPEAEREGIFEPYVRGSSATSARGLGLGLSICRRIVESHGGRIDLRAAPGGGSCFFFVLPAAEPKDTSVDTERNA